MTQNSCIRTHPDAASEQSRSDANRVYPDGGSIRSPVRPDTRELVCIDCTRTPSECEAERAKGHEAIQSEPSASAEPICFERFESVAQHKAIDFSEWIERVGADGRVGWDRPGQPVATRWWERTAFEDLKEWQ